MSEFERRPLRLARTYSFSPRALILGKGSQALEIAVAEGNASPTATDLRRAWLERHGGRAVPLVLIVLHNGRASICGPEGEKPPVYLDLDLEQVERLCRSALGSPDRHAALSLLWDALPETESRIPGLKNAGLLATHELEAGVPRRPDWSAAVEKAAPLLRYGGRKLLTGMGYTVEALHGPASVLVAGRTRQAVAVFLERGEAVELANQRFSGLSPVSYGLAQADQHHLPWVVVAAGPILRLYSAEAGKGVASRGRAETFVQLRLDLLRQEQGGYLWLLYSPDALASGGTLEQLLASSQDYAADLSSRLRERIYDQVVPRLAESIARARELNNPTQQELADTYEMALFLLFRLLFVAYAEDQRLLPYQRNDSYRSRSLKEKARELRRLVADGAEFGDAATHWREVHAIFEAVREGNPEWDVPKYDGTLFATDPAVSPVGAALEEVALSNREFGPALVNLLLNEGPEGLGPIDFRSLGVREFGTVYEGLLRSELSVAEQPLTRDAEGNYAPAGDGGEVAVPAGDVYLHDTSGRRKSTGTYYTKPFAVEHLLDHALEPALDRHLERLAQLDEVDAAERFFDFRVADIAMGSGHFLIATVDHIERRFAKALQERPLSGVQQELNRLRRKAVEALGEAGQGLEIEDSQLLRRQIARRCIYGVDVNPVAVHLARLSLWIHTFVPGLPLSFLDHSLVEGNSLLGIATQEEAEATSEMFGERLLWYVDVFDRARAALETLGKLSDADAAEIEAARRAQRELEAQEVPIAALFDILTASRIDAKLREDLAQGAFIDWAGRPETLVSSSQHRRALGVLKPLRPFHFPVRFPEVFRRERSGFDVIVGNPPWEEATLEEDDFWTRYRPGLQSLPQGEQERIKARFRQERPDLVGKFEEEKEGAERLRHVLTSGAFPGMGTGDPDVYKAFCWRFWNLARQDGGWIGVVLPRSAFAAKGSQDFRRTVFSRDHVHDLTLLLNNRQWVFEDVHPQYTIGLLSLRREAPEDERTVALRGPFRSHDRYEYGVEEPPVFFLAEQVLEWTDTAALPLLPAEESAEVFARIRKAPRLDRDNARSWRARPYAELHATNDRKYVDFSADPPDGYWPVFTGGSFDLWTPDTGSYFGWADPEEVAAYLQAKRERSFRRANSPFSEFPEEWNQDPATLPCHGPRIAFRDVSRATDTRTVRVALLPARIFLTNKAPFFLWPRGDEKDQAFLLAVMSSIPYDWYMRCFVETALNYHILNPSPVPQPPRDDWRWQRLVHIAGRLATPDERFADWARAVGTEVGAILEDEKEDLIAEMDAVVAHLYGLSASHVRHIFETFHEGWECVPRLEAVLKHYKRWQNRS